MAFAQVFCRRGAREPQHWLFGCNVELRFGDKRAGDDNAEEHEAQRVLAEKADQCRPLVPPL